MPYRISDDCIGCGACAKKCPEGAIEGEAKIRFDIDPDRCHDCGTCFDTCRQGAVIDPQGKRSPKSRKTKLVKCHIDTSLCAGCRTCYLNCPQEAIRYIKNGIFSVSYCKVDANSCAGCGTCTDLCITGAAKLV